MTTRQDWRAMPAFWGSLADGRSRLSREVAKREAALGQIYDLSSSEQAADLARSAATFQALTRMVFEHMGAMGCSPRKASALAKSAKATIGQLEAMKIKREVSPTMTGADLAALRVQWKAEGKLPR